MPVLQERQDQPVRGGARCRYDTLKNSETFFTETIRPVHFDTIAACLKMFGGHIILQMDADRQACEPDRRKPAVDKLSLRANFTKVRVYQELASRGSRHG